MARNQFGGWLLERLAYTERIREAGQKELRQLREVCKDYEAWEADVILNGDWSQSTVRLTQGQHDRIVAIAAKRNAALAGKDRASTGETTMFRIYKRWAVYNPATKMYASLFDEDNSTPCSSHPMHGTVCIRDGQAAGVAEDMGEDWHVVPVSLTIEAVFCSTCHRELTDRELGNEYTNGLADGDLLCQECLDREGK